MFPAAPVLYPGPTYLAEWQTETRSKWHTEEAAASTEPAAAVHSRAPGQLGEGSCAWGLQLLGGSTLTQAALLLLTAAAGGGWAAGVRPRSCLLLLWIGLAGVQA